MCLFDSGGSSGGGSGGGGGTRGGEDGGTSSTSVVVSASDDATARAWDPRSRSPNPIQVFRGAKDSLTGVGIAALGGPGTAGSAAPGSSSSSPRPGGASSSRPVVVTASVDGRMRSYDLRKGEQAVDDVGAPIAAMALGSTSSSRSGARSGSSSSSSDGKGRSAASEAGGSDCALLAGLDGRLRLLDLRSGARLAEFSGHDASCGVRTGCALFSYSSGGGESSSLSSSLHAACGSEDGRVCCWAVENEGEMASSVSIHGPLPRSSSSSASAASAAFSAATSSGPVTALAIRPGDSGMLLAAGTDGRVRVFQRKQR